MPVAFPSLRPTERDYTPPAHATTTSRSQNGVTSRRLWGSLPGNAELNLGFRNVHTDVAAQIIQAWLDTKSGVDFLILPDTLLSGVDAQLKAIMLPTDGTLIWTFADRPSVSFVPPIWATVQVRLIGELRMS